MDIRLWPLDRPGPCGRGFSPDRDQSWSVGAEAPPAKAFGWLTLLVSLIETVKLPCDTAAACSATPSPITTVPVRELNTTRARIFSACTCTSSSCDINATRAPGLVGVALTAAGAVVLTIAVRQDRKARRTASGAAATAG